MVVPNYMETFVSMFCVLFVVGALAANYIVVTLQQRREGKRPLPLLDASIFQDEAVQSALQRGMKIEAVKRIREKHAIGLKEAKDALDHYLAQTNIGLREAPAPKKKAPDLIPTDQGIRRLVDQGRIDEAIDAYRLFTGVDSFTARDAIEEIQRELDDEEKRSSAS